MKTSAYEAGRKHCSEGGLRPDITSQPAGLSKEYWTGFCEGWEAQAKTLCDNLYKRGRKGDIDYAGLRSYDVQLRIESDLAYTKGKEDLALFQKGEQDAKARKVGKELSYRAAYVEGWLSEHERQGVPTCGNDNPSFMVGWYSVLSGCQFLVEGYLDNTAYQTGREKAYDLARQKGREWAEQGKEVQECEAAFLRWDAKVVFEAGYAERLKEEKAKGAKDAIEDPDRMKKGVYPFANNRNRLEQAWLHGYNVGLDMLAEWKKEGALSAKKGDPAPVAEDTPRGRAFLRGYNEFKARELTQEEERGYNDVISGRDPDPKTIAYAQGWERGIQDLAMRAWNTGKPIPDGTNEC